MQTSKRICYQFYSAALIAILMLGIGCTDLFTRVPIGDNFQPSDPQLLGEWELAGEYSLQSDADNFLIKVTSFDPTTQQVAFEGEAARYVSEQGYHTEGLMSLTKLENLVSKKYTL